MPRIRAIPITREQARQFVEDFHRHHAPAKYDKYRIGAEVEGQLVGVVQVGRPVSRELDDGETLEVIRLCSKGDKDVCSFLYSRAARVARELGYKKIITYILETEEGTSLKASGWRLEKQGCGGKSWDTPARPRDLYSQGKRKYPAEKKQRWTREL